MSKKIKHILVIRFSAMGDVAMTIPVLRAFQQQYPEVKLTILTRPFFKPFFKDLKNVDVYTVDLEKEYKGPFGLIRLSKKIKALNIDAIADLHNVLRTNILRILLFNKQIVQIDKGRAEKKRLISGQYFKQLKTTHQRYADVFKHLGFPVDLSLPKFPKPSPIGYLDKKVLPKKSNKWIGVAPFAYYPSKSYDLGKMKTVIKKLSEQYTIMLFGGKNDANALSEMSSGLKNVFNLAGILSLNEELDVISNLDVMVSMDSANAHIAAMLGIPVISIWGVTHPYAGFNPFKQPENQAILPNREKYPLIPTSVYGNRFPKDYENAINSINEDTIIRKIQEVLT